jgi:hypothetical protein
VNLHNVLSFDTDTAALLVAVGDNLGRLNSEASFTYLCDSVSIDASSGLVPSKRLNPRGNRSANEALSGGSFLSAWDQTPAPAATQNADPTKAKQTGIMRCRKRYVARESSGTTTTCSNPLTNNRGFIFPPVCGFRFGSKPFLGPW